MTVSDWVMEFNPYLLSYMYANKLTLLNQSYDACMLYKDYDI